MGVGTGSNYAYDGDGQLSTVSWVHNAADNISYKHYEFGYDTYPANNPLQPDIKILNSVKTFALPVGGNQEELSTEGIERDVRKRIKKYTDPYGNTRTYDYINKITAADPNSALLNNADIGDFATIVRAFAAGNAKVAEWVYFYDENAHGKGAQEAYNDRTRITLYTDPNFLSKPTKVEGTDGTGLVFTYTPTGQVDTMTDSYGVKTHYSYITPAANPEGLLSRVVQEVGGQYYFRKSYGYDTTHGLVTSITEPRPNVTNKLANADANPAATDVVTTTITYDYGVGGAALGNVTKTVEPGKDTSEEIVTRFSYTDGTQARARYGKPTSVTTSRRIIATQVETQLSSSSCEYAQNRYNQVSKLINPLGYATNVSINPHGAVESVTDHYSKTVSMTYDNTFDQLLETKLPIVGANPNASSAKKVYTPKYLGGPTKTQQIYDEGETTAFRTLNNNYGKVGELLSSSNGNAAQDMTYTYDALYRLKTVKQGNLPVTRYDYNPATAIAGPNTQVTASDGTIAISYYKKNGQLDYVTQAGGTIRYLYYPLGDANSGRLKQVTYPNEDSVVYGYDTFGRTTSVTETIHTLKNNVDAIDIETTTTVYDNSGYVTKVTHHTGVDDILGKVSTMTYDLQGRLIATSVDGKVSKTIYDEVNLTVLNTSPDGSGTRKTFDKLGRTLKLELGTVGGNDVFTPTTTTSYTPNDTDRKMVVSYPGGETNTLEYDAWQRLKASTDAKGVKKEYQYKHLGLLTNINYPAALTAYNVTNQYDSLDRLQKITDFSGERTYSYYGNDVTGAGRLQKVATRFRDPAQNLLPTQATKDITYSYTDSGKRHTMGTPAGTYTYGYDTYGRWKSITNAQTGTTTCTLRWDGRITQQQLGNGATTDYTWTVLQGRLVKQTNTRTNNGQPAQSKFTNFVYDWKHQLTSYAADIEGVLQDNTSFTYDEKTGELLKDKNTGTDAYNYDLRGNVLHQPNHELNGYTTSPRFTRAYNEKNQWIGYTDSQNNNQVYNRKDNEPGGDPLFAYDANGNPTTYKGISASYDPDNNLTSYGDMLTAGYRSDGLRAWKQNADGVRTYFLYDGDKLVCELQLTGTEGNYGLAVSASTTWGPNGLADRYVNATGTKVYYQCDPLGNVIQRLDENNNVLSTSSYDSFGNTNITTMGGDPFGYKGKFGYYTDVETGLILCQHRYYDPATGRWLTRDPIGYAGGLNLYAYCGNEPVGGVDPSGYVTSRVVVNGTTIIKSTGVGHHIVPWEVFADMGKYNFSEPVVRYFNKLVTGTIPGKHYNTMAHREMTAAIRELMDGYIAELKASGLLSDSSKLSIEQAANFGLRVFNPKTYIKNPERIALYINELNVMFKDSTGIDAFVQKEVVKKAFVETGSPLKAMYQAVVEKCKSGAIAVSQQIAEENAFKYLVRYYSGWELLGIKVRPFLEALLTGAGALADEAGEASGIMRKVVSSEVKAGVMSRTTKIFGVIGVIGLLYTGVEIVSDVRDRRWEDAGEKAFFVGLGFTGPIGASVSLLLIPTPAYSAEANWEKENKNNIPIMPIP